MALKRNLLSKDRHILGTFSNGRLTPAGYPASTQQTTGHRQEGEEMNYADFDPGVIRDRNEDLRREVQTLRLEKRLRANREEHGSRFVAFARTATKPLLRVMQQPGAGPATGQARAAEKHTIKGVTT
ncbi:hypothetical protein BH18ACT10_BH18ACT10_03930 [soil metagenome]